ncbi:hypothetical protein BJ741DRAFT_711429 [Chytriomyces cf. hyalinus JEL632]|nr:hypothetical protein BJ741DRAFT_711429 [Chytriomyces cf. hyalinus JEL632]
MFMLSALLKGDNQLTASDHASDTSNDPPDAPDDAPDVSDDGHNAHDAVTRTVLGHQPDSLHQGRDLSLHSLLPGLRCQSNQFYEAVSGYDTAASFVQSIDARMHGNHLASAFPADMSLNYLNNANAILDQTLSGFPFNSSFDPSHAFTQPSHPEAQPHQSTDATPPTTIQSKETKHRQQLDKKLQLRKENRLFKQQLGASKPANAFILYRRDRVEEIKTKYANKIPFQDVSRIVGHLWKQESFEVREAYFNRAAVLREEHARLHGDKYKVFQEKKKDIKRKIQEEIETPTADW